MSNLQTSLAYFIDIQKGERMKTALLFLWFFLFICVYYVLRPVRRGLVLDGLGNENMPFVYIGTALVTGIVVYIYSKFAHFPRKPLIASIYGIFIVNLLAWWQLFQNPTGLTSGIFWVWLDVFSIMGVTLFWMYANDVFDSHSAKRLFGIIAGGGGLGAVLGSSITAGLVESVGSINLLLVAAGLVALTLSIFLLIERMNVTRTPELSAKEKSDKYDLSNVGNVFSQIFSNRFLLFLTLVVCFERITPDLVQFLYHEVLNTMATGSDAIAALDANLERWRGICEFAVEIFLVAAVMRKFGTGFSLASSGLAIAGSLACFAIFANPLIVVAIFHADESIRHSWFKSAKELTYTVQSREILYKVKPIIEMFFYRFSRGIAGVIIYLVNTVFALGTGGILAVGGLAGIAWAFFGWQLHREFRRLEVKVQIDRAFEGSQARKESTAQRSPKGTEAGSSNETVSV
ncbi:MAG: hypothetical protein K8F91_02265 [Candidatus Obscuribacterales bacterium]|nr:hypothetical protein [Candidatus Obscuribacterales bacterium]